MIATNTRRKHLFTPLRYPGGKTSLFEFFDQVILTNNWKDVVYIEPYAGGAGAALSLLLLGKVDSIVINDLDKAIYAFWKSILDHTEEFIDKINSTPLTIEEWERQKQIYTAKHTSERLELGFSAFYLNRTNRSGIIAGAGPIGGKKQAGKWKLNARYNKKGLIDRIKLIAQHKSQITVLNSDGVSVINEYAQNPNAFFYVDPPYFKKAANLYLNAFDLERHQQLAQVLINHSNARWVLSYDDTKEIRELYPRFDPISFSLRYSAHQDSKNGLEIMIFSKTIDPSVLPGAGVSN